MLSERQKGFMKKLFLFCAVYAFSTQTTNAMHIMEGFLPKGWSISWMVLVIPFLVLGYLKIKAQAQENPNTVLIFAMAAAYVFVISAIKMPSVTGSSSHATGIALGAILLGPAPMSIIGLIVLLFQAILLAHGGLTTIGANIFSMAIVGAFVAYGVYILLKKFKAPVPLCIFVATFLSNIATYATTSIQLGLAHPDATSGVIGATMKFLSVFVVTQVPLAIVEAILTVLIIEGIKNRKIFSKESEALLNE